MAVISVSDVKKFLRYRSGDVSNDDPLSIILNAGQRYIETFTGHLLSRREVVEAPASFPASYYDLRWKPYVADSLVVGYLDGESEAQTFDDVTIFAAQGTTRITGTWPIATAGVSFTYEAGYEALEDIPEDLIHALCLYSAMSDEDRAAPGSAGWTALEHLLLPYRLPVMA
jgi:hypothetical protein